MKQSASKFWLGISSYRKAYSFTKEHNLWSYYFLPAFLNVIIFLGVGWLGYYFVSDTIAWLERILQISGGEEWWRVALHYFVSVLIYILAFLIYFKSYKYLMLILLSPVLSVVAGKVQEILHPDKPSENFHFPQFLDDLKRGLIINLTNLAIELSLTITLILIGLFFPVISLITTILVIMIESYFIGFGMIDLRNEFMRLSVRESRKVVRTHRTFSIGVGLTMYAMVLIPILGILFAPIFACIAAGLGIFELEEASNPDAALSQN